MTDTTIIALATSYTVLTIVSVGASFMQSWWLRDAKDDARRYSTQATGLQKDLDASAAVVASLTSDLKTANARVEAIDAENQKLRASMPVAGSFDRLLSSAAAEAGHGASPGSVPDHQTAAPSGIDELLDPAKS